MEALTEKQIDTIYDWIIEQGIEYESLKTDLLDHICCHIEQLISNGENFEESFNKTKSIFADNELKKIQESTLYFITLKYQNMKKFAAYLGITTATLIFIGVFFKLMHWPGAGISLTIGLITLSIIVFPTLIILEFTNQSDLYKKLSNAFGLVSAIILSLGTLFKIMHWPGASMLIITGLSFLGFIFLPLNAFKNYKLAENKLLSIAMSSLIFVGAFLFWSLYKINF